MALTELGQKRAPCLVADLIKHRGSLLNGICPDAIELLNDTFVSPTAFDVMRKMKPVRQIEVADLMITAGNWTTTYAKALLASTRPEDLAKPGQPKKIAGLTREELAQMEREMFTLHQDFKQIENSYGDDILHLVIASGYVAKLVTNSEIEQFLATHYPEFLREFRAIIAADSLVEHQGVAA